ncbi:MAG: RNA 2'-phosphotransferase [Lachnospiraceae bacterium]|nr:RNA 2'-phosphotransferase [Lachnospiraceae bacterium]
MNLTKLSRFLSFILRHDPGAIGITVDEHGWADVQELIEGIAKTRYMDMAVLEEIVSTDEKQRYSFNEDKTLIRANQGHSIPVDVELPEAKPPVILYHGTAEGFVESIEAQGLKRQSRLYVHLSVDPQTAKIVGSRHGKKHGKPVIYEIHADEMCKDGYVFYLSVNGVWLTKSVPAQYITRL